MNLLFTFLLSLPFLSTGTAAAADRISLGGTGCFYLAELGPIAICTSEHRRSTKQNVYSLEILSSTYSLEVKSDKEYAGVDSEKLGLSLKNIFDDRISPDLALYVINHVLPGLKNTKQESPEREVVVQRFALKIAQQQQQEEQEQ